jgi:hypothetical protein
MPKIYKPFTDHSSETIFAKLFLQAIGAIARDRHTLSTDFRVFLLGLQRVSNKGHASFEPGEMARLLKRESGTQYEDRYLRNIVKVLINAGLVAPASNIRCLIYPVELIQLRTDKKQVAICPKHGTHSSWSTKNNDWVSDSLPTPSGEDALVPTAEIKSEVIDLIEEYNSIGDGSYGSY